MPSRILILILGIILTGTVSARNIPEDKRVEIDKFLALTGASQLTNLMANALTRQILQPLEQKYGPVDPAMIQVIFSEAKTIMYEEFTLNNKLNDIFYDLYDEYFTSDQMKELVRFYSSPTGKIAQRGMQDISQRSMVEAKKHATTLGPKIQQRLVDRLDKIGLVWEQAEAEK